jgi:hypothetical protein
MNALAIRREERRRRVSPAERAVVAPVEPTRRGPCLRQHRHRVVGIEARVTHHMNYFKQPDKTM